jgi:hypothetical protein
VALSAFAVIVSAISYLAISGSRCTQCRQVRALSSEEARQRVETRNEADRRLQQKLPPAIAELVREHESEQAFQAAIADMGESFLVKSTREPYRRFLARAALSDVQKRAFQTMIEGEATDSLKNAYDTLLTKDDLAELDSPHPSERTMQKLDDVGRRANEFVERRAKEILSPTQFQILDEPSVSTASNSSSPATS